MTAALCTCMAGTGEVCSHIAALLFYLEVGVRLRNEKSCTDGINSWLPPHVRKLNACPISSLDFASSAMKKRRLDESGGSSCQQRQQPQVQHAPAPSEEEWGALFDSLLASGHHPCVAATNPKYSDLYVPTAKQANGADLRLLYDQKTTGLTWPELTRHCNELAERLSVSDSVCAAIEKRTRGQSSSRLWSRCDASFQETGLFIAKKHLFLAATPDLLVECSCCGPAVVEVKCPWTVRDTSLTDLYKDPNGPVIEIDKAPFLKRTHSYFYQCKLRCLLATFLMQSSYFGMNVKSPSNELPGMRNSLLQK